MLLTEVSDRFALLFAQFGMPRMAAAVLARLYAADSGSLTAAELVAQLRVSPATVSAAVGRLEERALIRRDRDPGTRRDRYVIDESAWYRATLAGALVNERLAAQARHGADALGVATPAGLRLLGMGDYLERVGLDMVRSAERWRPRLDQ
ncbi:MarR family transcriptional regulator [Nocardia sp. NPDC005825]|uniref:GbsR/MarR family transcriptional regulator n=1 Tax=unclassified Nocardia TaxID=2637762 RepID=UPI0033E81362